MAVTLCKKLIDDGSPGTYYGLDNVTANALGWQGVCSLGAGDRRGLSVHPTTAGEILKTVAEWAPTEEPLLARLVREKIVSPPVASLALNRGSMVEEVDYKAVDAEIEKAKQALKAERRALRAAGGPQT